MFIRPGVSLEAASLFLRGRGRGKAVYISPSSDPTLALLLVGYTEYDDNDDDVYKEAAHFCYKEHDYQEAAHFC
ncbi:hypothetical protein HanIR_Chr12g0562601 [Helianthus annuus]|nr:hypothetical protein HanIR_Chr12g0562601 [Helianthus annuus]